MNKECNFYNETILRIKAIVGDRPNSFYLEYNDEWGNREDAHKDGAWHIQYYPRTPVSFVDKRGNDLDELVKELYEYLLAEGIIKVDICQKQTI